MELEAWNFGITSPDNKFLHRWAFVLDLKADHHLLFSFFRKIKISVITLHLLLNFRALI